MTSPEHTGLQMNVDFNLTIGGCFLDLMLFNSRDIFCSDCLNSSTVTA